MKIDTSAVKTYVMDIDGLAQGHHMTYDDPDGGWFFAVTTDGSSNYRVDSFLPFAPPLRAQAFLGAPTDGSAGEAIAMDWNQGNAASGTRSTAPA